MWRPRETRLVDVVDVLEAVGAEVRAHEVAHLVYRDLLEDAAQVHQHVEPETMPAARAAARAAGRRGLRRGGVLAREEAVQDEALVRRALHEVGAPG